MITPADLLAFIVEMAALVLVGRYFWALGQTPLSKIVLLVLSLVVFGAVWGLFLSPKATYRLTMPLLLVAKLIMLGIPLLLGLRSNHPVISIIYGVLLAIHLIWATATQSL